MARTTTTTTEPPTTTKPAPLPLALAVLAKLTGGNMYSDVTERRFAVADRIARETLADPLVMFDEGYTSTEVIEETARAIVAASPELEGAARELTQFDHLRDDAHDLLMAWGDAGFTLGLCVAYHLLTSIGKDGAR